ncbi:barstar family protein [Prauserella rugosa]|uniref:RNAse (Barnase) inhibitor barstar n=1 Tax=Prauserella rugosa TaxID=43354 RepID=A0A660CC20_9PSEU|nr:barstar family protein [Prauserella rugosa]KMS87511.1 barnase inhibitor [Streptomyces regensis]TWH18461.1 RNAse (barnase) inhibitor barstar [Prauserella rugosa]
MTVTSTPNPDSTALVAEAKARGAFTYVLDGSRLTDKAATLDAIAELLRFPSYFGRNLDALYDCLTDLSWLPAGEHVLVWVGANALKQSDPRTYLAVHGTLSDAQRALAAGGERADSRRFTVLLADS